MKSVRMFVQEFVASFLVCCNQSSALEGSYRPSTQAIAYLMDSTPPPGSVGVIRCLPRRIPNAAVPPQFDRIRQPVGNLVFEVILVFLSLTWRSGKAFSNIETRAQ
jgi:hypothetical protein